MITISGDVIYFEHRPVGFVTITSGTLRDSFEEVIEGRDIETVEKERDELQELVNDLEQKIIKVVELLS